MHYMADLAQNPHSLLPCYPHLSTQSPFKMANPSPELTREIHVHPPSCQLAISKSRLFPVQLSLFPCHQQMCQLALIPLGFFMQGESTLLHTLKNFMTLNSSRSNLRNFASVAMMWVASLLSCRQSNIYECCSFGPDRLAWNKRKHSPSLIGMGRKRTKPVSCILFKEISLEYSSILLIYRR